MDIWFLLCFGVEGIRILALGWDALIDFLCFIGYYLVVGISSFSTQILSMVVLWNLPSVFRIMAIW